MCGRGDTKISRCTRWTYFTVTSDVPGCCFVGGGLQHVTGAVIRLSTAEVDRHRGRRVSGRCDRDNGHGAVVYMAVGDTCWRRRGLKVR